MKNRISTILFCDDNLLQRVNKGPQAYEELILMFDYLRHHQLIWEFPVGLEIGKLFNTRTAGVKDSLIESLFWNNDSLDNFSGAFRALIPVENSLSGDKDHRLSKLRKFDENVAILEQIISSGVPQINLGVMIGWPEESHDSIKNITEKLELIDQLCVSVNNKNIHNIKTKINYSIFCVTPLPGTPFYNNMHDRGK